MPQLRKRKARPQETSTADDAKSKCLKLDDHKSSKRSRKTESSEEKDKGDLQDLPAAHSKCNPPSDGSKKYDESFFKVTCEKLACQLLGKKLVRKLNSGKIVAGLIVETEAYLGGDDKAAHSYNGKRTNRNEAMYMEPGTIYVYHIYGTYTCVNISSQGDGAAVLIRGLDPSDGLDEMRTRRGVKRSDKGEGLKDKDLGNGPSKLTQALNIDKQTFNQKHIVTHDDMWLEPGIDVNESDIVASNRIGVDYAAEWAKKPLRFYIKGNKSVSVKDKIAEQN